MSDTTEIQALERHGPVAHGVAPAKRPLFIDRPHGRLFAIHHPSSGAAATDEVVVYLRNEISFAKIIEEERKLRTEYKHLV